jgi:hypothetical protein
MMQRKGIRMNAMYTPVLGGAPLASEIMALRELVVGAARCWRVARDGRAPVQQRLYAWLMPQDRGVLAPVFDSLLSLWEAALGRPIVTGQAALSVDEHLLLGMLVGTVPHYRGTGTAASLLDIAVRSARVMIAMTPAR